MRSFSLILVLSCALSVVIPSISAATEPTPTGPFPVCGQLSPLPSGPGWTGQAGPLDKKVLQESIDNLRQHGFTGMEMNVAGLPETDVQYLREYAVSQGMFLVAHAGILEGFNRDNPPEPSVYSPEYAKSVQARVEQTLGRLKDVEGLRYVFTFHDEPFHANLGACGHGPAEKQEFKRRYGYDPPDDPESVRDDPQKWLDVLNFHSDNYPDGWRQTYQAIKKFSPNLTAILTHDSHNTFGGGCRSNAITAMDDVIHWGGDFTDMFVFDIYPYMMFDFRFGKPGYNPQPRMSQAHYSFAQMRNVTRTHNKTLGFWFGTYNPAWFKPYMGEKRKSTYWSERVMSTTAVAAGANFLITGYRLPTDAAHWKSLGEGLRLIQKAGKDLLDAPRLKAKACMIFPRSQFLQLQQEYFNVGLSFELFSRAFGELDILHEDQVVDDTLDGYDIVVLFDVELLPQKVADRLAAFVEKGGTVIADCVPTMNELRQPTDTMQKLFGVKDPQSGRIPRTGHLVPREPGAGGPYWFARPGETPEEVAANCDTVQGDALGCPAQFKIVSGRTCTPTDAEVLVKTAADKPALLRHRVGKGQTYLLGFCLQDTYFQTWEENNEAGRTSLRNLLQATTADAGVTPHVWSSNPAIEAAVRANDRHGFLFLINHETKDPTVTVRLADLPLAVTKITDLSTDQPVEFSQKDGIIEIKADVPLGETRILRIDAPASSVN